MCCNTSMPGSSQRSWFPRNVIIIAAACGLLAISESASIYVYWEGRGPWRWVLAFVPVTWLLMVACWPLFVWLARKYTFAPGNRARSAAIHIAGAFVFALLHSAALTLVFVILAPPSLATIENFGSLLRRALAYLSYQDVVAYGALLAMYLALHYGEMRAQLADAHLIALRAQLNPHFFFNTLNAVSTLALQGRRDDVAEIIGRLGDLMRTALDAQAQEVPLSQELAFMDDYLAVQTLRFGDRFRVERAIDPYTLDALVPSLVLQPIIENAIEYGVAADVGSTSISIETSRYDSDLVLMVSDTGPGFAPGLRKEGIGLANSRARIKELHGSHGWLEYGNRPGGGATVRIRIPFRSAPARLPRRVAARSRGNEDAKVV